MALARAVFAKLKTQFTQNFYAAAFKQRCGELRFVDSLRAQQFKPRRKNKPVCGKRFAAQNSTRFARQQQSVKQPRHPVCRKRNQGPVFRQRRGQTGHTQRQPERLHQPLPRRLIKRRSLRLYPQGRRKRRNSVDPVGQNSSRVDNGDRRSPFLRPPCAQNANCRVEQQNQRQRPGHKRAHTAFFFRQCAFRQQHVRAQASRRPADLIPRKLAVRGLYCHSVKRYRTGQSELFGQNSRCGFPAAPPFLRRSDLQRNKQSLFPFLFSFCPLFPSIHMYIHHKKDGAEPLKIHENRVDFCHGTCYDIENRILQLKIEARERISNAGQEDVRSIRPARKGKPPKEIRRTVSWAHGTRGVRLSLFAECYYNCGTHGAQQWLTIIMADASVIFCIIRKESIT